MQRGKLVSAALFLGLVGALLILPPLATMFQLEQRFLGLPAEVIYLFVCWGALIAGAYWLSKRLPHEAMSASDDES
jgi:hypothetical protein